MIEPHGGTLINQVLEGDEREEAIEEAKTLPKLTVNKETVLDIANIATGTFSPLTGFVGKEDFDSIVENKCLKSGLAWTMPVVLQVPETTDFEEGQRVALYDENQKLIGILSYDEKFSFNFEETAQELYRTTEMEHPGVKKFHDGGTTCIAGKVELINMPDPIVEMYELTPLQTREEFKKRGWNTIVGFQTRNGPHRAHEYLQKTALELVDGLLVHPLIGWKKQGDYSPEAIIKGYEALIEHYYPSDRVMLAALTTQMRYAGPREAVFHAIIRKNHGCSHFIVGGDHAGVGGYYETYDAHKIFDEIKKLGITIVKLMRPHYCKKCDHIVSEKTCPHGDAHKFEVSGTLMRKMISEGETPPKEQMREEVAKSLTKEALN